MERPRSRWMYGCRWVSWKILPAAGPSAYPFRTLSGERGPAAARNGGAERELDEVVLQVVKKYNGAPRLAPALPPRPQSLRRVPCRTFSDGTSVVDSMPTWCRG